MPALHQALASTCASCTCALWRALASQWCLVCRVVHHCLVSALIQAPSPSKAPARVHSANLVFGLQTLLENLQSSSQHFVRTCDSPCAILWQAARAPWCASAKAGLFRRVVVRSSRWFTGLCARRLLRPHPPSHWASPLRQRLRPPFKLMAAAAEPSDERSDVLAPSSPPQTLGQGCSCSSSPLLARLTFGAAATNGRHFSPSASETRGVSRTAAGGRCVEALASSDGATLCQRRMPPKTSTFEE